jgi:DNA-binding HxlR family transcriptional regulator
VIRDLSLGRSRYEALRARTGTLAARLKHLEATGVVERIRYQERPPRDEYRLTPKGCDPEPTTRSAAFFAPAIGVIR